MIQVDFMMSLSRNNHLLHIGSTSLMANSFRRNVQNSFQLFQQITAEMDQTKIITAPPDILTPTGFVGLTSYRHTFCIDPSKCDFLEVLVCLLQFRLTALVSQCVENRKIVQYLSQIQVPKYVICIKIENRWINPYKVEAKIVQLILEFAHFSQILAHFALVNEATTAILY